MKRIKNLLGLALTGLMVAGLAGCDNFASVKGNKNNDSAPAQQQAAQTSPSAPPAAQASQPKPQPVAAKPAEPKPLAANEIARVGDWRLTVDEFNQRLDALREVMPDLDVRNPEAKKLILDELVRQQLLVTYAEEAGISKDKDIAAAIEEFRRTLLVREVALRLTENVKVSDAEAREFYEQRKDQILEPTEYHVREIVIKDKVKANEVLVDVLKGTDFAELARNNSESATAKNGGDLGYITQEPFPEMAEQILALEVGESSNVFKGPDGFYIIKLEDTRGGGSIPFEDIKQDIVSSQMLLKQQEVILEQIEKIKEKTPVEVRVELLN